MVLQGNPAAEFTIVAGVIGFIWGYLRLFFSIAVVRYCFVFAPLFDSITYVRFARYVGRRLGRLGDLRVAVLPLIDRYIGDRVLVSTFYLGTPFPLRVGFGWLRVVEVLIPVLATRWLWSTWRSAHRQVR